ncbi:SCO family protein [Paraburkholderia youngii]|uniref:SCO family protein n=1 Tax=Paraburkholderia youngii TaxID=2782701 RepID=UPI003D201D3F
MLHQITRARREHDFPARKLSRRALLSNMALAAMAAICRPSYAQHGNLGLVSPPARLDDFWVIDQTAKRRRLNAVLLQGVTAVQTIYTGCSSVCPLQGALFSAVQEHLPKIRARYPVQLLSIGIDPLSDSPSALRDWLLRFDAGPAWNAATPSLEDVDRMRIALSGSPLALGNLAGHSTQIYCFDASAKLRWRSAELPRLEDVCDVLAALGRV